MTHGRRDSLRIDRAEIDESAQKVRAGDPASTRWCEPSHVPWSVYIDTLEMTTMPAMGQDEIDAVAVVSRDAPEVSGRTVRRQSVTAGRKDSGGNRLLGRVRCSVQPSDEWMDLLERSGADRPVPGRPREARGSEGDEPMIPAGPGVELLDSHAPQWAATLPERQARRDGRPEFRDPTHDRPRTRRCARVHQMRQRQEERRASSSSSCTCAAAFSASSPSFAALPMSSSSSAL